MLSGQLPRHIDPQRFAAQRLNVSGQLLLKLMSRLAKTLVNADGEADVNLDFGIDDEGYTYITGNVQASVQLECQRCLLGCDQQLRCEVSLAVVKTEEEAKQLPSHYDPFLVTDDKMLFSQLVEDELLLALPIVAYHAKGECSMQHSTTEAEPAPKKPSPFAVLAELKKS